jgi:hypothetical protein
MKIIVFLVTAFINLVAAAAGFFILLLGLNGYSERQATPSLILYLVLSVLSIVGFGALAVFTANFVVKKNWVGNAGAAFVATISSSIVGGLVLIVGLFIAFALAEVVRGMK